MSAASVGDNYVNSECYICNKSNYIHNAKKIIVCDLNDKPKHWSHKKCQRQWAMHKRELGLADSAITCGQFGIGGCQTNLAHLLPPLPQKSCREKTADFLRPVLRQLIVGLPLVALSVTLIGVGAMIGTAAGSVLEDRASGLAENGIRGMVAISEIAGIGAAGAALAGIGGAALHAAVAIGAGEPLRQGSIVPEIAIATGLVGAFALTFGVGWLLSGALAAASASSTYCIARRIFG